MNKIICMLLFIGGLINQESFASAKQNFNISLRVVEPTRFEIGGTAAEEASETKGNEFNIKALKGASVEISLEQEETRLKNQEGKELEVRSLVRVEENKGPKNLGRDEELKGAIDVDLGGRGIGSNLLQGEYAGEIIVNVNYN